MSDYKRTGSEELQAACNLIGNTRSDFADRFTAEQLLLLYRAYQRSEWDITPDEWTDQEIADALGVPARSHPAVALVQRRALREDRPWITSFVPPWHR